MQSIISWSANDGFVAGKARLLEQSSWLHCACSAAALYLNGLKGPWTTPRTWWENIHRKEDTVVSSSAISCSPAWRGEFTSRAWSCHIPGPYTHWRASIEQIFHRTTDSCYWPIAGINLERRLDPMCFLTWGRNRKVLDPIYDVVQHLHNPKHSHSPRNSPRSLFIDQLKEIELTSLSCPLEATHRQWALSHVAWLASAIGILSFHFPMYGAGGIDWQKHPPPPFLSRFYVFLHGVFLFAALYILPCVMNRSPHCA